jgi:hypothetical protein
MTDEGHEKDNRALVPEQVVGEYERMHRMSLHYENLLYSSTSPIFTLCLALAGVIISQERFELELRLLAATGGLTISFLTVVQVSSLRNRIKVLSSLMGELESQHRIGFSRKLYQRSRDGFRNWVPTNMTIRFFIFLVFSIYFFTAVFLGLREFV